MKPQDVKASSDRDSESCSAEDAGQAPQALKPGMRTGADGGEAATILEQDRIKVTCDNNETFFRAVACDCKDWMCPDCRKRRGLELLKKFLKKQHLIKTPKLYTITINRILFSSPEEAYHYVMKKKFLARLLTKEMKVRRWVWVMEIQEKTGDGWPHWHILIDVSDLPLMWYCRETKDAVKQKPENRQGWIAIPHFFDLNKVHRLLRKWGIGEQCYLSETDKNVTSPEQAIRYIMKYLIKSPERGFPPWALKTPGMRFYQPSHDFGSLSMDKAMFETPKKPEPEQEEEEDKKEKQPRVRRSPIERISECKMKTLFIGYDKKEDRFLFTPSQWGLKETVPLAKNAVCVQDFNFDNLSSYESWGFNSLEDIHRFQDIWEKPILQAKVKLEIQKKRDKILARWDT